MAMNELRAISTFAKAAELGSLRQAASAQGITPQAASLALGQLESHLGVRLFHRTTRSLCLPEEGRQFLDAAQPGLATLQRAVHGARRGREEIAGPLRITAPRSMMLEVIWPVVDEFVRRYPLVEPDVQLEDRIGNWVEDRVDVGFRSGYPPEGGVIARRLLWLQLVVCATPDYLARHGTPQRIEDLAQHALVGFDDTMAKHRITAWLRKIAPDAVFAARSNSVLGLVYSAKAGVGVAPLPIALGDAEPDLVQVIEPVAELTRIWRLLTTAELRHTPRVAAFFDFIVSEIDSLRPIITG